MNRTVHFCEEEEEKSSVQSKTKQINNTLANETSQIEAFSNENQHTPHTSKTRTNKQTKINDNIFDFNSASNSCPARSFNVYNFVII